MTTSPKSNSTGYDVHPIITTQTNIAVGLLGLVLLTSLGLSYGSENWKPVEVEETWEGTVRIGLSGEVPVTGYVAHDDAWAKLWNLYRRDAKLWNADRSDEKSPSVDFNLRNVSLRGILSWLRLGVIAIKSGSSLRSMKKAI